MNRSTHFVAIAASSLAVLASSLASQSLITDLAPSPSGGSGAGITEVVVAGGLGFFSAHGGFGRELYVSDGSTANTRMVKDLGTRSSSNPGASSNPQELTALGNEVLFTAIVEGLGRELWKSDGTAAGTVLVADLNEGTSSSRPEDLQVVGANLVCSATLTGKGRELCLVSGDQIVPIDIQPGSGSSDPTGLTVAAGAAWCLVDDGTHGQELFRVDLASSTATLVRDIGPGEDDGMITQLTPFAWGVVFVADDGSTGTELWRSDGSEAGTVRVVDLAQGAASSEPEGLSVVAGELYFSANTAALGRELYRCSGTAGSVELVADLHAGAASSNPTDVTAFGDGIAFAAADANGRELWRHVRGKSWRIDLSPAAGGSDPHGLVAWGGSLYFAANDGTSGVELWRDDGRSPYRLKDLVPGARGGNPINAVPFGSKLLFAADHANAERKTVLWATDGTPGWTHVVLSLIHI